MPGLFLVSSIASGLSPNYGLLLVSRALQAVAAGMISANLSALIMAAFPEEKRGKALGLAATTISLGLAVGPWIGGIISGTLGWRYVFFVTPVLGLVSIILCYGYVPESRVGEDETMDIYGSSLILACLGPATIALTQGRVWGWTSPVTVGLFMLSLASAWLFLRHEKAAAFPVIELKLFSNPDFTLDNLATFISFVCLSAMLFATPFFLQYFLGMSPQGIGLVISFVNAIPLFLLMPSGILSDRVGTIRLEIPGMALICLSLALLALTGSAITPSLVMFSASVLGLGYGAFCSPNYSAIMGSVPESRLGVAGGVYGTMRNLGSLAGILMLFIKFFYDRFIERWQAITYRYFQAFCLEGAQGRTFGNV